MENLSELYIEEVTASLIKGHAAVLVGAGFSKNAEPVSGSFKERMPDWSQLSDAFCEKLGINNENDKKYLNSLAVAQEVEDTFGRPFLNNLIIEKTADNLYNPSDIHVNLLRLPWSDVFTTNYDTLLERACEQIAEKKYHIVVNQNDLLYSSGTARIVKLHGSFPSNGPFIITEEDFRRYPNDHAPFVNTVQQSLLENTFCLIGFSGEDPNFLKWIGWIHDNLGLKESPKIFLITHAAFSSAKRKTLQTKNVEVIALSDIEKYQSEDVTEIYRKFLSDILNNVTEKKKHIINWPADYMTKIISQKCDGRELLACLQNLHSSYPGWIVLPYRKHSYVESIMYAVEKLLKDEIAPEYELDLFYEYCWLYKIIGRPLLSEMISKVTAVLKQHSNQKSSTKYKLILFQILYSYRVYGMWDNWDTVYDGLRSISLNDDENNELIYENAMHDIYNFKFENLGKIIDSMAISAKNDVWALRKSSILAMIGRYNDAKSIIKESLTNIRYVITRNHEKRNSECLSIEGCLVILYNYIIQAEFSFDKENSQENDSEIEEIEKKNNYDFIWHDENSYYENILGDEYVFPNGNLASPAFGIGSKSYSYSFGHKDVLQSYQFLRFRELTGVPFRLGMVTFKKGVAGAAKRLSRYNEMYPALLATLTADTKIIKDDYSRSFIYNMPLSCIDDLCDLCAESLSYALNLKCSVDIDSNCDTIKNLPLEIMPEVLSRLCVRCSTGKFEVMVQLLYRIYSCYNSVKVSNADTLLEYVINYIPGLNMLKMIDSFWGFPIIDDTSKRFVYPDPFSYIYCRLHAIRWIDDRNHHKLILGSDNTRMLENLFLDAENNISRGKTLNRLLYLSQIYLFSDMQRKRLEKLLFVNKNLDENGLPYLGEFPLFAVDQFVENNYDVAKEDGFESPECISSSGKESGDYDIILKARKFSYNKIIDKLEKEADSSSVTLNNKILVEAIGLIKVFKLAKNEIDRLICVSLKICHKFDRSYNSVIAPFSYKVRQNARMLGLLLSEALLRNGYVNETKSYCTSELLEINRILASHNIPSTLLTLCVTSEDRELTLTHALFCGLQGYPEDAVDTIAELLSMNHVISQHIIELLINAVLTSNSCSSYPFTLALEHMITYNLLSKDQCDRISNSIIKYIDMTNLKNANSDIDIDGMLVMRQAVSHLSCTLYLWYNYNQFEVPKGVQKWKYLACESSDEFADIRTCWDAVTMFSNDI